MAEQFYYLVPSLPDLRFGERAPMTGGEFLHRCRGVVPDEALRVLEAACADPGIEDSPPSHEVLVRWKGREVALRNALARGRARRLGLDPARHVRGDAAEAEASHVAREAFDAASPRMAEEILDRARWRWLEELEAGHYFDLGRLVIYLLKVRLLERRAAFSKEAGRGRIEPFRTEAGEASRQAWEATEPSP